jgi:hypothetical protein
LFFAMAVTNYLLTDYNAGSCRESGGGTGFQPVSGRSFTGKVHVPLGGGHQIPDRSHNAYEPEAPNPGGQQAAEWAEAEIA